MSSKSRVLLISFVLKRSLRLLEADTLQAGGWVGLLGITGRELVWGTELGCSGVLGAQKKDKDCPYQETRSHCEGWSATGMSGWMQIWQKSSKTQDGPNRKGSRCPLSSA